MLGASGNVHRQMLHLSFGWAITPKLSPVEEAGVCGNPTLGSRARPLQPAEPPPIPQVPWLPVDSRTYVPACPVYHV